jgi:hypothetical protein
MWRRVELHTHSRLSDGKADPAEVVVAAAERGVDLLAITDHHEVEAYREARQVGRKAGVVVLPGTEITCPTGQAGVHLLGVFPSGTPLARIADRLGLDAAGRGQTSGYVPFGVAEAVTRIQELRGLAIAAHASSAKGLLRECRSHALAHVLANCRPDAIELGDAFDPAVAPRLPSALGDVPVVSGSDAHYLRDFQHDGHPYGVGARAFWARMTDVGFSGLRAALQAGHVGVVPPWLDEPPPGRLDTLLALGEPWVRFVHDDREDDDRERIVEETLALLDGDGGHVLVGVRRRFGGATRGAALTLSLEQLQDLVTAAIHPTPVLRARTYQGRHGQIHELIVLPGENPGRAYARRPRHQAQLAARADRLALTRLGVLPATAFQTALAQAAKDGVVPAGRLRGFFPYRDWFSDQGEAVALAARSIVHALAGDRPDAWLLHWARETPQAARQLTAAYREAVRREQLAAHRDRVRQRLDDAVARGELSPGQRTSAREWWEQRAQRAGNGEGAGGDALDAASEVLRARGANVFGRAFSGELDAEAQRVRDAYEAALRVEHGAEAAVVLEARGGERVPWARLAELGIDVVLTSGSDPQAGPGGIVVAVPDPTGEYQAGDLLDLWARPEPIAADTAPQLIRRSIEVARIVPVLRAVLALDRGRAEALGGELAEVGATAHRRRVLGDVAAALELPAAPEPAARERLSGLARVDGRLDPAWARALADLALYEPVAVAEILQRDGVAGNVADSAAPGRPARERGPAIVLAGALGDERLLNWWEAERSHPMRLAILDGLGVYAAVTGADVDALLLAALDEQVGSSSARRACWRPEGRRASRSWRPACRRRGGRGRTCWAGSAPSLAASRTRPARSPGGAPTTWTRTPSAASASSTASCTLRRRVVASPRARRRAAGRGATGRVRRSVRRISSVLPMRIATCW